jgi:hypothetical protein
MSRLTLVFEAHSCRVAAEAKALLFRLTMARPIWTYGRGAAIEGTARLLRVAVSQHGSPDCRLAGVLPRPPWRMGDGEGEPANATWTILRGFLRDTVGQVQEARRGWDSDRGFCLSPPPPCVLPLAQTKSMLGATPAPLGHCHPYPTI